MRPKNGNADVLILGYHGVSETWTSPLSVTPKALESQMKYLLSKGYRGVTFTQAALEDHPGKVVSVTFDDAYDSVDKLARPILDRLGIPGTIYAPTRYMGQDEPMSWPGIEEYFGGPDEKELLPMSWERLRSAVEAGWEIGSHTVSHPHLTALDDEPLRRELVDSRKQCAEMTGTDCTSIAFPYGDHDQRVIEASREAGYSAVATIPWRLDQTDRFVWPRTGVFYNDSERAFRLKVSPMVRRIRASRLTSGLAPLVYLIRQGPARLRRQASR
jgi:peptidoglycan/xylan/chitin deacetylase (PgdA/CDA1 family)